MAPPKRKTGGRVTPTGTRPTDKRRSSGAAVTSGASAAGGGGATSHSQSSQHYESGRYTAPTPKELKESPPWVPVLMLALFIGGGLLIMIRYLFWDSNVPMIIGMVCLLGGLYTATKWR